MPATDLLAWNIALQNDEGNTTRAIAITGTATAPPGVPGRMVIDEDGTAVIRIACMPGLAPAESYEAVGHP